MSIELRTKTIRIHSISTFEGKFEQFNRKARKLGLPALSFAVISSHMVKDAITGFDMYREFEIEISYPILKLSEQWELIAILDHKEHLSKAVPGQRLPPQFIGADAYCDYCRASRHRNETFIVRNVDHPEEYAQVGRQCLGAFLGIDPSIALGRSALLRELGNEEEWGGARGQFEGIDLAVYLSHVQKCIRLIGWTSGREAQESGKASTASLAWDSLDYKRPTRQSSHWRAQEFMQAMEADPSPADIANAKETIAWMKSLDASSSSDYLRNLLQIAENDYVTSSSRGYAASAYAAMRREQDEKRQAEEAKRTKSYVGTIGGKFEGELLLLRSSSFDSEWGVTWIHNFQDASGNVIIWKTGIPLNEGLRYCVKASIKDHALYRGIPQTVITRAKTQEIQ